MYAHRGFSSLLYVWLCWIRSLPRGALCIGFYLWRPRDFPRPDGKALGVYQEIHPYRVILVEWRKKLWCRRLWLGWFVHRWSFVRKWSLKTCELEASERCRDCGVVAAQQWWWWEGWGETFGLAQMIAPDRQVTYIYHTTFTTRFTTVL